MKIVIVAMIVLSCAFGKNKISPTCRQLCYVYLRILGIILVGLMRVELYSYIVHPYKCAFLPNRLFLFLPLQCHKQCHVTLASMVVRVLFMWYTRAKLAFRLRSWASPCVCVQLKIVTVRISQIILI